MIKEGLTVKDLSVKRKGRDTEISCVTIWFDEFSIFIENFEYLGTLYYIICHFSIIIIEIYSKNSFAVINFFGIKCTLHLGSK